MLSKPLFLSNVFEVKYLQREKARKIPEGASWHFDFVLLASRSRRPCLSVVLSNPSYGTCQVALGFYCRNWICTRAPGPPPIVSAPLPVKSLWGGPQPPQVPTDTLLIKCLTFQALLRAGYRQDPWDQLSSSCSLSEALGSSFRHHKPFLSTIRDKAYNVNLFSYITSPLQEEPLCSVVNDFTTGPFLHVGSEREDSQKEHVGPEVMLLWWEQEAQSRSGELWRPRLPASQFHKASQKHGSNSFGQSENQIFKPPSSSVPAHFSDTEISLPRCMQMGRKLRQDMSSCPPSPCP